jgi:branched-subunit amino acid aminotransferase/4-amino-4-deoxychorismate lyase
MSDSSKREILYVQFMQPVKDPLRSNGQADCFRQISNNDLESGKQVRRIWYEDGQYFLEALMGPHKGQLVSCPASNVLWARYKDGLEREALNAKQKKAG